MRLFIRWIESINEWVGRIFSWLVAVLTFVVVFEVILRYFFNHPTVCNFEITKQLYGLYFMILSGYALLHNAHVSVDIVYARFSVQTRAVLDVVSYLLFFFPFCGVVIYFGTLFAIDSWQMEETSWSACGSPLYYIKTVVPLSFGLITLQGIAHFLRTVSTLIRGDLDD